MICQSLRSNHLARFTVTKYFSLDTPFKPWPNSSFNFSLNTHRLHSFEVVVESPHLSDFLDYSSSAVNALIVTIFIFEKLACSY